MTAIALATIITTNALGIVTVAADTATNAIHRIGSPVPSHTVAVTFPLGKDDAANWEGCELGEPSAPADEVTLEDALDALKRLGVNPEAKKEDAE